MLSDIIKSLPAEDAFDEMINRFDRLLIKYARILAYEDSYNDLLLFFIELLLKIKNSSIIMRDDAVIVNYIATSVKNHYIKLLKQSEINRTFAFSELSESQKYCVEQSSACQLELGIKEYCQDNAVLTDLEQQILIMVFEEGYSIAEIARRTQKTRQAINQTKNRALRKMRKSFEED